jgi:hypothetical protein
MINFFNTAVCMEILALIAAIVCLTSKRSGYWALFLAFLLITLSIEGFGYYYKVILKLPNYIFYNMLMLIQVVFFSFLFNRFSKKNYNKILLAIGLIAFITLFIIEGLKSSFDTYNKMSRISLSYHVVFFSCLFYFNLLRDDSISSPLRHPPFWIITGLFFYYFGTAIIFSFFSTVAKIKLGGNISFYNLIMGTLSFILYSTWVIAFIWKKKQARLFSQ